MFTEQKAKEITTMYQIYTTTTAIHTTLQSIVYHSKWAAIYSALKLEEAGYATAIYVVDLDTGEIVYDFMRA
jgi:hypothetical protein